MGRQNMILSDIFGEVVRGLIGDSLASLLTSRVKKDEKSAPTTTTVTAEMLKAKKAADTVDEMLAIEAFSLASKDPYNVSYRGWKSKNS
ncbi:MAG: hypothetical protein NT091_01920 [Candidatus Falkowbacteria bacterium]|nr:hypothetical protein [Candidatus Falkowbacteria bacterium]